MNFDRIKIGLFLLFVLGMVLSFYAISLDDFLNLWDERFHALVAKNMMDSPLMPTLYKETLVDIVYDRWDRAHIWLHKQPLFMWQIMASMKVFGVNEFAVRLPSAIMNSLLVLIAYGIGSMAVNRKVGLLTAFLYVTSFYMLQLVSGRKELEHNDIAFLFYVSASIWAWLKYLKSEKLYWVVLIGAFAGAAILCKWLSGLLVYLAWGVFNLQEFRFRIKAYIPIIISLIVTFCIIMPWQVLIFSWYPAEAKYELSYNFRHFSEVIEGHDGNFWYHFSYMKQLFGRLVQILVLPALILYVVRSENRKLAISFVAMPVFVYLFYSVAATKMPSYPIPAVIPIYVCIAYLMFLLFELISNKLQKKWISSLIIIMILILSAWLNLRLQVFGQLHDPGSELAIQLTHNKQVFKELNSKLPEKTVIFNVKGRHYIECMFYTDFPAYNMVPSRVQYDTLKSLNYTVAIFKTKELPDFLEDDEKVILIHEELMGYN